MPASESDLLCLFEHLNIETNTTYHAPMYTVEESQALRGELQGGHCKSLFLKDKKHNFLLVVMSEDQRLDIKALSQSSLLNVGRLSFASADRMVDMLGVTPGSVTPFSLVNVTNKELSVVLDAGMLKHDYLNYHPLHNEATTTILKDDLLKFINHFGFSPIVIDFDHL